jgi:hypothetical protein
MFSRSALENSLKTLRRGTATRRRSIHELIPPSLGCQVASIVRVSDEQRGDTAELAWTFNSRLTSGEIDMKRGVDAFVRLVSWLTLVAGPTVSYADAFVNRNYQDIATSWFPGVTVATLSLGPGQYTIQAKLRLRNTSELFGGSCVFQGVGIGGLDSTAIDRVGEVSAVLMDVVIKNPDDDPDVNVQCFGPDDGSVHVINTQFIAISYDQMQFQ